MFSFSFSLTSELDDVSTAHTHTYLKTLHTPLCIFAPSICPYLYLSLCLCCPFISYWSMSFIIYIGVLPHDFCLLHILPCLGKFLIFAPFLGWFLEGWGQDSCVCLEQMVVVWHVWPLVCGCVCGIMPGWHVALLSCLRPSCYCLFCCGNPGGCVLEKENPLSPSPLL